MAEKKIDAATEIAKRKAYGLAMARLRQQHKEDFEVLREQACAELGVEYVRRMTPEERAEEQMKALLAEFPALRETLA